MTAVTDQHSPDITVASPPPPPAPPVPPPPPAVPVVPVVPLRAGQLTLGWRMVMAITWVGVIAAFAAVWNTSVQLGLSTWWLGPRGDPQPQVVRLLPFVAPLAICIAVFNNLRRLPYLGLGAAVVVALFGVGDLGRVAELAALELLIAGIAAAVSAAALTGMYREASTDPAGDAAATRPT
jgi:hypothetical protein